MIEIKGMEKSFGKLKVLRGVDLKIKRGSLSAILGPNASGKTTIIKSILGLVIPDAGEIVVDGNQVRGNWDYRNAIGYMPQIGRYPDNMTIAQVIEMMKDIRKSDVLDEDLVKEFNLPALAQKKMRTLSGGTRQKVSASLAFLFNPDVLILDEPTAGLDPLSSEILKQKIIAEKEKGKLILITSHILSELDDLVTEIIYMQEGKLQFHKSIAQLQQDTGQVKLTQAIAHVMKTH